jgi:histidyl-tRNA synthetase
MLVLARRLWRRLGLENIELQINTIGSNDERRAFRGKLIEYFEQHRDVLDADAQRRLHSNPLRILDSKNPAMQAVIEAAPKLMDHLGEASLANFNAVLAGLEAANIPYVINPRLVRGLDYYNLTVFEWVSAALGAQSAVCSGGRYDGLFEQLGGKATRGCGFGIGVERLLLLLEGEAAALPKALPDVWLVHQGTAADAWAPAVAEQLRDAGLNVVLHCGGGGFKAQMKKADASGARFAVIIGDNEAQAGTLTLKPLRHAAAQQTVALQAAADIIKTE